MSLDVQLKMHDWSSHSIGRTQQWIIFQEHVRMFKTYGTSVNTRWGAARSASFPVFLPLSGNSFITSTFLLHRMASPWCSPSKPNAASFFCFDLSIFFLFASSAFFKAKTVSTDACSNGGGT